MILKVDNINYKVEDTEILHNISLKVKKGEFIGIIGANGSGKSTLLKNIYRVLKPNHGTIYLDSKELKHKSSKEIARELAVVSQEHNYGFDFSVKQIVLMGRYPLKDFYESENRHDVEIADEALDKVGMKDFGERNFSTLSGGEKQRVLIARAIAQESEFIVMDEPTNHLDVGYQIKIMDLVCSLNKTVLTAIHDLNMAVIYCDKLIVIDKGRVIATGKPEDVITEELIKEIYDAHAHIEYNDFLKRNLIIFKSINEVNK